jgi:pimeloyl-ACP methyl ester carboxylesterase
MVCGAPHFLLSLSTSTGLQVLLWSYPGQAGSEVRSDQCLNNEYLASCLSQLLTHVGPSGTKEFDSSRPFHLLGFGNGACVATYYAAFYRNPSLRSLLPINGFTYIDPNLAGVLHDCLNVFSCSPPSRPDLPVYFWSRFLFSPHYLSRVSTPLALNLYTAVHNPITVQGRLQIINGALSHVDLRPLLKDIHVPIIAVHSTVGALARPSMLEPLKTRRNGEARSIFAALNGEDKVHTHLHFLSRLDVHSL